MEFLRPAGRKRVYDFSMAKKTGQRKDQKKRAVGTSRTGKTNQYQARKRKSIGSSKPGGDGPGTKKWTKE
jgi:hypothetical protein